MATILVLTSCPMEGCHVIIFISQNRNPNFPQTLAATINLHGSHRRFRPPRFCSDASPPMHEFHHHQQHSNLQRAPPPRTCTSAKLLHSASAMAATESEPEHHHLLHDHREFPQHHLLASASAATTRTLHHPSRTTSSEEQIGIANSSPESAPRHNTSTNTIFFVIHSAPCVRI